MLGIAPADSVIQDLSMPWRFLTAQALQSLRFEDTSHADDPGGMASTLSKSTGFAVGSAKMEKGTACSVNAE